MKKIKLYSYVVTHDTGFAPNPYFGVCTLACCKPKIRKSIGKHFSDFNEFWIIGLSSINENNRIIYVMKVSDVVTYQEYYNLYPKKIPDFSKNEQMYHVGDNIYKPVGNGNFIQLRSVHSKKYYKENWEECIENKEHDLKGRYVLISDYYYYFGSTIVDVPNYLNKIKTGRATKCTYENNKLLDLLESYRIGINGSPTHSTKEIKKCKKC